jgi:hypothetical protein
VKPTTRSSNERPHQPQHQEQQQQQQPQKKRRKTAVAGVVEVEVKGGPSLDQSSKIHEPEREAPERRTNKQHYDSSVTKTVTSSSRSRKTLGRSRLALRKGTIYSLGQGVRQSIILIIILICSMP